MLSWINEIPAFLLVMVRLTTFFITAPIYSMRGVPATFKVGFSFFVAIISYSTVSMDSFINMDLGYIFFIMKEAMIGLALGFVAALILYTVQVAGGFIDFQMGFAIANVVDPQTGAQVPIIGNFKYTFAILFLLAVDGHHMMLEGVIQSYQLVPVDVLIFPIGSEPVTQFIIAIFVQMFLIAFQIAIPVVGTLFLVTVALGITARTVPQLNIFVVGIPIQILIGFIMILITLPAYFYALQRVFRHMIQAMGQLLQILGG